MQKQTTSLLARQVSETIGRLVLFCFWIMPAIISLLPLTSFFSEKLVSILTNMEDIGQNLMIVFLGLCMVAITVTVGRFNMRARFVRKPDGTTEVDEAGDQSIGAETDNTQAKVNVVNEKVADPQPKNP